MCEDTDTAECLVVPMLRKRERDRYRDRDRDNDRQRALLLFLLTYPMECLLLLTVGVDTGSKSMWHYAKARPLIQLSDCTIHNWLVKKHTGRPPA